MRNRGIQGSDGLQDGEEPLVVRPPGGAQAELAQGKVHVVAQHQQIGGKGAVGPQERLHGAAAQVHEGLGLARMNSRRDGARRVSAWPSRR